jgi:hypothetical protein
MSSKRKATQPTTRRSKRKIGSPKEEEPADDPPKDPTKADAKHEKISYPLICACTVPCTADNECPCSHSGCRSGQCGCACFDGEPALLQRNGCIVTRGVGLSMTYHLDQLHHQSLYQSTHTVTHRQPVVVAIAIAVGVVVVVVVVVVVLVVVVLIRVHVRSNSLIHVVEEWMMRA